MPLLNAEVLGSGSKLFPAFNYFLRAYAHIYMHAHARVINMRAHDVLVRFKRHRYRPSHKMTELEESSTAAEVREKQRCPICLEDFDDKTFIDPCFHIHLHLLAVLAPY